MKKLLIVFLLTLFFVPTSEKMYGKSLTREFIFAKNIPGENNDPTTPLNLKVYKSLGLGINTDGIFSRDKSGQLTVNYTNEDFAIIKKAGFKHVRVLIRVPLMNESKPDSISLNDIKVIKKVLDEILKNKLMVVFNPVHASKEFKKRLEDEPLLQASFIKFWGALAANFSSYDPNRFLVEPFNEPHFVSTESWNHLQDQLIAEIRKVLPKHTLVVTPVTETIAAITAFKPVKDKNVIYTFHYYLPFELTHQGASWTWKSFPAGYTYPNKDWNIERMKSEYFEPLHKWAQTNDIKLYGGEYGVIRNADKESRLKWFTDAEKMIKEYNYPSAVWEFKKGDFSILQLSTDPSSPLQFDKDILKALGL